MAIVDIKQSQSAFESIPVQHSSTAGQHCTVARLMAAEATSEKL